MIFFFFLFNDGQSKGLLQYQPSEMGSESSPVQMNGREIGFFFFLRDKIVQKNYPLKKRNQLLSSEPERIRIQ